MQNETNMNKKRKRALFKLCTVMTLAAFLVLTGVNIFERDLPEIILNLFIMALLVAGLMAIKKWDADLIVYRVSHFAVCLIFFYCVVIGTGKGTALYWVLIMPPLFFYFFGKKEGLLWTVVFSSCICLIVLLPSLIGGHSYSPSIIPRFISIFFILIVIGYGLESSRDTYSRLLSENNEALLKEKMLLEQALGEIKTLHGLIPICCHCKKIRNDQGYWQQVETYMRERTNADFSHGICPECFEIFYPQYKDVIKPQQTSDGRTSGDLISDKGIQD